MAGATGVPSRTATPIGTNGSMTVTSTEAGPSSSTEATGPILRLRAQSNAGSGGRRIQWAEDVIDNEGMGKKSSKVCCIYHKPKNAGDSDSEDSSSSEGSDSEPDLSKAQPSNRRERRSRPHKHDHDKHSGDGKSKGKDRAPSPNAYERVPQSKEKT